MFEKERLCGDGPYATRAKELCESDDQVNGEEESFAHGVNATTAGVARKTTKKPGIERQFINSPSSGLTLAPPQAKLNRL